MNWWEASNLLLVTVNISLGVYCVFRLKKLSNIIKIGKFYYQCRIILQGILLVELYFILVLFSWVTYNIYDLVLEKSSLVTFLYVTAFFTKSFLFFIIILNSIFWTNKKLK